MKLSTVILAFLANRSPAAYSLGTIVARVNNSRLLDEKATDESVFEELTRLNSGRLGALVDVAVDPVTKDAHWYATDAGVRRWTLAGRLVVEA